MYRFLDSWVVERTLFEFVNQGGCACCGMSHGSARAQDLMALCTDVETDDGKRERASPWPAVMRDEIWSERVRFRRELKARLPQYAERFPRASARTRADSDDADSDADADAESGSSTAASSSATGRADFFAWFRALDPSAKRACFQMPRDELHVLINTTYSFKASYQVVLCAVIEQLTHYDDTGYSEDGASEAEVTFEECLVYERGAFTLIPEFFTTDEGMDVLFERFRELGGPSLLPKRPAERAAAGNAQRSAVEAAAAAAAGAGGAGADDPDVSPDGTQSFRSDRRLVRLVVARYFADVCWRKYERATEAVAQ